MDIPESAQIIQNAKKFTEKDSNDFFVNVTKGTVNGALTGAVIGAGIGFYKNYNIYGCILLGIIIGGVASNQFIKYNL